MANPNAPAVECDQLHAGLAATDLQTAIDFYVDKLGFFLAFRYGEPPNFAGVNLGNVQIFLQTGGLDDCSEVLRHRHPAEPADVRLTTETPRDHGLVVRIGPPGEP